MHPFDWRAHLHVSTVGVADLRMCLACRLWLRAKQPRPPRHVSSRSAFSPPPPAPTPPQPRLPAAEGEGDLLDDFVLAATEMGPELEQEAGEEEKEGGGESEFSVLDSEEEEEGSSYAGSEDVPGALGWQTAGMVGCSPLSRILGANAGRSSLLPWLFNAGVGAALADWHAR